MQISISWHPYRHWTAMCYDPKDCVKHARHSLGLCTIGKNCVGQRSLFTLGVYLNVYLKHLRLMSGSGHEGSSRSFPATFNRVFQAGKQSWVSAIVGALGVSRTTMSTLLFVSLSRGWPCRFFVAQKTKLAKIDCYR